MINCLIKKEKIDSGFMIKGTEPEREILYSILETILNSETGKPLLKLLDTKKKVGVSFQQKSDINNLNKNLSGYFNPFSNQIFLNITLLRSRESRISTLTHELFHVLQYNDRDLHNHLNKGDSQKAFLLNELETRFKSMEIISELFPYKEIINLDLNEQTKIDCLIYGAVSNYYQNLLMKAGQKSESRAKNIAKLLAKTEMLEAQASCVPGELHHLMGDIWSGEFQAINIDWHERYKKHKDDWSGFCSTLRSLSRFWSILRLLSSKKKPELNVISEHISARMGIPHTVFQKKIAEKITQKNK